MGGVSKGYMGRIKLSTTLPTNYLSSVLCTLHSVLCTLYSALCTLLTDLKQPRH